MEEERVVVKAHDFDSWRAEKKEQRKKRVDPFSEDLFPTMESPKFQVVLHLQGDAFSWMPEVFATTLVHLLGAGAPDDVEILDIGAATFDVSTKLPRALALKITELDKEALLAFERRLSETYAAATAAGPAAAPSVPEAVPEAAREPP